MFKRLHRSSVPERKEPIIAHIDDIKADGFKPLLQDFMTPKDEHVLGAFQVSSEKALIMLTKGANQNLNYKAQNLQARLRRDYPLVEIVHVHESVLADAQGYQSGSTSERVIYEDLVKRFVDILKKVVSLNASDIHILANPQGAQVKARLLGEVVPIAKLYFDDMKKMLSSVYNQYASSQSKDITFDVKKLQRTVINMKIDQDDYQLRFESCPIHPEGSFKVVIRLLHQSARLTYPDIAALGYSADQVERINHAKLTDHGLIIISGETGSGKSTTLSTLLHDLVQASEGRKVIYSIESPVEYVIEGVAQTPVHQGLTDTPDEIASKFSRVLQARLRQDPDVVMVGEISDRYSAKALQESVQSGHKVLTTIHAASALKVFSRLVGLGLERDVISEGGFLDLIIHQKLIPVLCKRCALSAKDFKNDPIYERLTEVGTRYHLGDKFKKVRFRNHQGCKHCKPHNGIVARRVIAEMVIPSAPILSALNISDFEKAYQIWRESGGISYQERGIVSLFKGEVCPRDLEARIGSLSDQGFYAHIDQKLWPQLLGGLL